VGGLTICRAILAKIPDVGIVYFADDNGFPYGLLDEATLKDRLRKIVENLLRCYRVDLVVVACNTASTSALPELRSCFDVPFVGVVPAIKPAARLSENKCIGLLATPATIIRPYTDKLIADFAVGCRVVRVGSNKLVELAEDSLKGCLPNVGEVAEILEPFSDRDVSQGGVDTIVLGCTHFPLLIQQLDCALPGMNWIDSGEAIATRIENLLIPDFHNSLVLGHQTQTPHHQILFSGNFSCVDKFNATLESFGFKHFTITANVFNVSSQDDRGHKKRPINGL